MKKQIDTKYGKLNLFVNTYDYNKRLAISLEGADEFYDLLTINLTNMQFSDINQAFISQDMDTFCPEIISNLKELGVIEKSYGYKNYNLGKYELVDFNLDKLKEYDSKGVEKFLEQVDMHYDKIIFGIDYTKEFSI